MQNRNTNMWLDDIDVKPRFLIHDRDRKYPGEFKAFWKSEGVRSIPIPLKALKANGVVEQIRRHKEDGVYRMFTFFRTLKEHVIYARVFRRIAEVRQAVGEFVQRYNQQWWVEKDDFFSLSQTREAWALKAPA
jgi:hypothetical protein